MVKNGQKDNVKDERKQRLAKALRENLKRRKDLQRATGQASDKASEGD